MEQFIGCDAHKRFSIFATLDETGEYGPTRRVGHGREEFRAFLQGLSPGSQIALETSGCYYWMVDEMEEAGHIPLLARSDELPRYSRQSMLEQLQMVDSIETEIRECEQLLQEMLYPSAERDWLDSLPCVGKILSAVMALEIGEVSRFGGPDRLVSYVGLVPVARESAEWKRQGRCPRDCNVYLKWAYVEAANLVSVHRKRWPERHVAQLYERVKESTKLHGKAVVAVGRHLAEASYWILKKQQLYQEPKSKRNALS